MPLEEILDRIIKDTEKEEEEILSGSREKAKQILEEAKGRTFSIQKYYESKAKEEADTERKQRTSSATLEGRFFAEKTRESIEDKYMEALGSRVSQLRATDDYLKYLSRVIERAKKILGDDAVVYLDEGDAKRMKGTGLNIETAPNGIGPLGGAIVTSADGKMSINLTFAEAIRRKSDEIKKIVREYING